MPRTVINRTVGLVARRCSVPAELAPITDLGIEKGDDEVAGLIWEKVEAVAQEK